MMSNTSPRPGLPAPIAQGSSTVVAATFGALPPEAARVGVYGVGAACRGQRANHRQSEAMFDSRIWEECETTVNEQIRAWTWWVSNAGSASHKFPGPAKRAWRGTSIAALGGASNFRERWRLKRTNLREPASHTCSVGLIRFGAGRRTMQSL